jgi:hypothetical protein
MTDDGTVFNYDISSDLRPGWSDKSVSHLPLNKATSFLNIYCDEFNSVAYGPFWFAINVYTADPQPVLENSAVTLSRASVIVDFTQNDGVLPRGFASTNTQSFVGVPDGWEYDGLDMFKPLATQFHRTYIGEDWPHNWGADLIEVGVLANAADGSQSFLALTDAKPVMLWTTLKVDKEHLMPTSITGNIVTVKRGENGTHIVPHVSGTKVYQFHNVGQVNRATELLPEFRRVRYDRAQASNLFDTDTQLNVSSGSFSAGDVIQIEAELMKVTSVNAQTLAVTRGFDGTDRVTHWAGNNIYKILNYSPVYTQSPLDAGDPQNYTWDYWDRHFDGIVLDLQAIPWVYTACPQYMFYSRGTVTSVSSNILQDSSKDWWAPDSYQAQFKNGTAYILDGNAAGKVFYVLTSGVNTLQLADINTMQPVDLVSQGVRIGDHFKVKPNGGLSPALLAPTKEHWQRYVDYWYMIMDHLTARYPQSEFYLEFWCEPNIYGNWTGDIYCELYKKFSATLRTGGVNFENPIPRIKIGAGSSSTGFMFGFGGNYEYYERLIKDCPYINFVSQHRYGDGLRMDKRRFAWESAFLKKIARKSGKEIEIFDSENTYCAGMIGTGREVASHNAYGEVSYWGNAFVKYFYGDHGADGRYRGIFQFLLLSHDEVNGFGLFANGKIAPSFWPIKLFAENTTPAGGDIFAKTLCGGDAYGWVQTMAYSTPEGAKKIWIANKKPSPIIINLSLPGSSATAAKMDSCIGSGPYQTIDDGYQPFGYAGKGGNGVVRSVRLTDLSNIVLEPHSANAITLEDSAIFYGDPSGDGSIDAYDAALVAKHSVGLITLSPEQQQKAEVSGDGLIDAYDAALIAKRAVGLIDKFPVEQ